MVTKDLCSKYMYHNVSEKLNFDDYKVKLMTLKNFKIYKIIISTIYVNVKSVAEVWKRNLL